MYLKIIELLTDGEFHTGDELGVLLGVSRAAIWKKLQPLKEMGLDICSVKGKGYRLSTPIDLLNVDSIKAAMNSEGLGLLAGIDLHASLGSTNDLLMQKVGQGVASGSVCLAEYQSSGRGRRGRSWVSPFGSNVYLSLAWNFYNGMAGLEGLSLAVGVAVADLLSACAIKEPTLKWPNDVLIDGGKAGGILLEVAGDPVGHCTVVIGVGLNYKMPEHQKTLIDQSVSQLSDYIPLSRNQLTGQLIGSLLTVLRRFDSEGFSGFSEKWNSYDAYADKPVSLVVGDKLVSGIARGVTSEGGLNLETADGLVVYKGGEVSLRSVQ